MNQPMPGAGPIQVSNGLNLTLQLRDPDTLPALLGQIARLQPKTNAALKELHFVHFARFLPSADGKALLVITEFDGELETYVMDFAATISDVFTAILSFVRDAPPLPVHEHPQEFWTFIQKNNGRPWPLYSSYPDKTVLDILGPRTDLPPPALDAKPWPVDFGDVQGNILRGYRPHQARHFALQILQPQAARDFLAAVVSGDASRAPQLTTAEDWGLQRPSCFLNVGATHAGLQALGVPAATLAAFPAAFRDGPADALRAGRNGDTGISAPEHWLLGAPGQAVHLLVSLYADAHGDEALNAATDQLRGLWPAEAIRELSQHEARALPGNTNHFGYVEDIGQPLIAGISSPLADMQPQAGVGEFLLGSRYTDIYGGTSLGALDPALAQNGAFAAVRIMKQNVAAFDQMLNDEAARHDMQPEEVAAKLMGRWRNGDPLSLVPDMKNSYPASALDPCERNNFDFAPTPANPQVADDFHGAVCPVGAHIRRMNPRAAAVAGKPYSRRIMRRGLPYEIAAAPADPGASAAPEKGLFGLFICADLERQFEFLLHAWALGDTAASGIRGTQDPFLGNQPGGSFLLPGKAPGGKTAVLQLPRLVETRGSVYLFLPSVTGLRTLARLKDQPADSPASCGHSMPAPSGPATPAFDPDRFNAKDPAFLADPYPSYALFRRHAPVHYIPQHRAFWVFSHALVTQVCEHKDVFLKKPRATEGDRGLFFMDPPRHAQVRGLLNPLFERAIAGAADTATRVAGQALHDIKAGGGSMELIAAFARRVPRDVFMSVFGVPQDLWSEVGGWADTLLRYNDRTLPDSERIKARPAALQLGTFLQGMRSGCPAHAHVHGHSHEQGTSLMCLMKEHTGPQGLSAGELIATAQNFVLGGYLSAQFLVATGVYKLLLNDGKLLQRLQDRPELMPQAVAEMLRFDAPFQMADRYTAKATVLGGVPIPADALVVAVYGSANRDEQVFEDADSFSIDRPASALSYGFGHGAHECIGAPLVETVVPIALQQLIKELPGLRLADDERAWLTDPYFRSLERLQLRF
jgi:cytochrome P450/deferrochelatase/peroxidase EfeB